MSSEQSQPQGQMDIAQQCGSALPGSSGVADLSRFVAYEEMRELQAEITEMLHKMLDLCIALATGPHGRNGDHLSS